MNDVADFTTRERGWKTAAWVLRALALGLPILGYFLVGGAEAGAQIPDRPGFDLGAVVDAVGPAHPNGVEAQREPIGDPPRPDPDVVPIWQQLEDLGDSAAAVFVDRNRHDTPAPVNQSPAPDLPLIAGAIEQGRVELETVVRPLVDSVIGGSDGPRYDASPRGPDEQGEVGRPLPSPRFDLGSPVPEPNSACTAGGCENHVGSAALDLALWADAALGRFSEDPVGFLHAAIDPAIENFRSDPVGAVREARRSCSLLAA